jgi:hypothetical protein
VLSALPSIVVLGVAALVALLLVLIWRSPPDNVAQRLAASRALSLTVGIQCLHFAEEFATGFYERFPELFGLPPMSVSFFVAFNLIWLAIWVASIPGVHLGQPAAIFAAWLLAIAAILNGIGHPVMAVATGGYFPGLVTSPFIGVAGVWLWLRLYDATHLPEAETESRPAS